MAMRLLRDHPAIKPGLEHWFESNRWFKSQKISMMDVDAPMYQDFGLGALAETLVGQQLLVKAAATIWGRVRAAVHRVDAPGAWDDLSDDDLRALGLSRQKVGYIRALATAVREGQVNFKRLKTAPNSDVVTALTALPGVGVWTAQMILIYSLARPDVWPAGDLGIQDGVRLYRGLNKRPDAHETQSYGARVFRKHPTAAALLLWRIKDGGVILRP